MLSHSLILDKTLFMSNKITGPTLLFERFYARKQPKKFFACAVHRTRKCCKFFHWEEEPLTNQKRQRYKAAFHEHQTKLNLRYFADKIKELPELKRDKLWLCEDCGMLIMTATEDHSKHRIRQELNDVELRFPSRLLYPMDDDKGQAVSSSLYYKCICIIMMMHLKETASTTNQMKHGSFSYIPVVCLFVCLFSGAICPWAAAI